MTMLYHEFQGLELSALGMGAMRLPVIDGDDARVDENAVKEMVAYAIEHGVNYFDTAWGYHNGQSELALGRALAAYPRDSFYLADKFPGYDLSNMDKVEEIFEAQLEKCGVDYFDFYLFHNVCELNIDAYLNEEKYGTYAYLMEQKRNGRIRHLGFSAHGSYSVSSASSKGTARIWSSASCKSTISTGSSKTQRARSSSSKSTISPCG